MELTPSWFEAVSRLPEKYSSEHVFLTGDSCSVPENGTWIEKHWFSGLNDKWLGSANMLTNRMSFEAVNGFDESLESGEDYDLCRKVIDKGGIFEKSVEFKAIHWGFPKNLGGFMRRELWHGQGDFRRFSDFRTSLVAQLGIAYVGATLLTLISVFAMPQIMTVILAAGLLLVNLAITLKRFGGSSFKSFAVRYYLNFLYFQCRGLAWTKLV